MTIQAKHFDVRLNQWIHIDNNQTNQESLLQEKISNTLLERFLPNKKFSFGHMDAQVTAKQLENHPEGHSLLLSSKTRLLYGSPDCLEVIDQLCPDRKDRGAYGSIFLGGCRTAIDTELNVLVIDDSNGDNGGIINNEQAYKLTGDCYGQIADNVYRELTGHQDGDKYRVIQHRFGWTPEDGNDDKFRFGKGTFRPANLDKTLQYTGEDRPKIDVIIPISSFKGTDKDNPNSPTKPQIKPGLYKQKVWIGEKSQSELGKTAISQVLASFPKGIKDFTEKVELEAKKLAEAGKDPRKLAQLYCEKYEKRKEYLQSEADNLEEEISEEFNQDKQNNVDKLRERLENDSFIYKVIKADLAGDCQLLETEKVKNELTKFVQGEWRDIAIGKKLQFERALVIPSKKLNNGEIFIPKYNEGEQVLNFRSPFLNSNGMCISTNKIVEDALAPDGKTLEGIIVVSDETSEHIYKRLSKQIEEILPDAIAKGLQTNGIEEYLNQENYSKLDTPGKIEFTDRFNEYTKILNETGFDIQLLPYESEQERQARDYDGDCIGFERASKYPNLTAEAIERNLPEKAYAPTVKLKKASFYDEQGNQPSFETIAKHMSDGISVGIINNHLTSLEALESEMEVIKEYGDVNLQVEYISGVGKHYENLFKKENPEKVETLIPDKYREYINDVIGYAIEVFNTNSENRQEPLLKAMDANKNLYRELIADAAYQNQIAVDLFKSSTTPDIDSINQNSRLLHRSVNYIKDKKNSKVYDTETIKVTGYSPVELIIAKTNQYFKSSQVESRPLSQFQDFFKGVDYTNQQRMHSLLTKKEFDTAFNAATRFSKRRETEKGPSVELELNNGKKLDVSNLLDANNQKIWDAKSIKVKIIPIDSDKISSSKPHKYAVYAQVDAQVDKNGKPEFSRLGNISKEQEFSFSKEIGVEFNTVIDVKNHQFQPALSEGQAKLLYNQAYEVARNFYDSIPLQEKESMAAAAWAISTTRESIPKDTDESEIGKEINKVKKVSNFVFAAFENEIIERTKQLQLENTKIIKFDKNSPIFKQDAEIRYNVDKEGKDVIEIKNENGEYKTFAELESQASRLPIGTTATATANYNEIYTATVTTQIPGKPPITFDIKELIKYELGQQPFNGEQVELEIQCVNRAQEDYVIYGKDSKGNAIKIGRIDDSSVKQGIEQAWLQEKPGQGQNFQLKLTQIVSGKNAYVIGETPDGNMLRINLDHNFKENNIQDTDYRNVTMKAHGVSNVYMATINGKPLGKIGVIPRSGLIRDKSLLALKDAGIIKNGQITVKIPTTIQSNQTTATVTLNQETIKYPKQWTKRHNILNSKEDRLTFQEDANNKILSQINTRPTILFQDSQQKLSGKIGLAIDENCLENIKFYLDKKGIEYEEMPKKQANLEAKKGMTVLIINESTLSKQVKDILIERAGSVVKNNDVLEQNIPIITEQTVYFIDPNQKAIGFVVPDSNVTDIQKWLDKEGSEFNCLIEENNNTTIILVKEDSVDSLTIDTLNKKLGKPIDVSTIEGFDRYEANSKNLNEADSKQTPFFSIQYNEYQKAIKQLPNRPRKLAEEEIPLSFAPASPLEKDSQTPIQTKTASIPQKVLSTEALIYKDEREISVGIEDQLAKARAALGKEETPSLQQENTQSTQIEWARYAPKGKEGYELSSVGDARFSALNAKLQDGRTIEEAYQLDVKGYRSQGDNWRLGKGKAPLTPMTKEEGYQKYKDLWKQWAQENPRLMDELAQKAQRQVLTDKFASTDVSQARALAEILSERTQALTQKQESQQIVLPSSKEANKNVALEIMGKINESKVLELRQHLEENYKPLMDADKSNYASGRQVAWVNAKWELKEKDFSPGIKDDKLMELVKQVYPDANIALVTYSEREEQGIDYHRDDSYAAAEARSINIGVSMWGYQTAKEKMVAWDANANDNAPIQEFKLESGTVTRFNSKNPHAALETSAGRWSINVWSIKNDLGKDNSVREKFDKFQASNQEPTAVVETNKNLTIKDSEWTPGSEIKVERSYSTLSEANTAGIIRMGNATQERASAPNIPDNPQISGKPIPMNWELNQPPELKDISTTIDAMRGKGRVHSTRAQNYYQTYGIKEGDIAIAKGKDDKQVAFRVGKQYKITQAMIDNPNYQKAWENWEKHSVKELTQNQAAKGKERQIYGLFMEPLGDYQNGKITPFEQHQQQERTLNITFNGASRNNGKPNATASAAAILVNPEERVKEFSQYLGNKTNNEAEFQAAIIGMKAAQDIGYKSIKIQGDSQLVVEALQGKRNVNAENLKPLYQEAKSLLQSFDKIEISYVPREQNKAADSLANKALDDAAQSINPIAHLEPVSQATAKHMVKDNAMAKVATQYIGISAAPKDTPSSTRNYAEAWSDKANTGSYTNEDTIMVSGSGPWRGINQTQIEENFKKEYVPLLDKAITARSDIVVGNAKGTDELVKNYLQEKGYKLEQTTDNYAKLSSQEKEINSHEVQQKTSTEELVINPNASGLGAVLSNATDFAKKSGKLENDYQVSINGNPEAQAGKYGLESHDFKPAGIPYNSAEHAYVHQSQVNPDKDPYKVMVEVLQAKIEQHPRLAKTITKKGGIDYLENAQIINEQDKQWEGKGKESKFVRALAEAYTNIVEKSSQNVETAPSTKAETDKPKNNIEPGIIISSRSSSQLGASLTSTTVKSKQIGSIDKDYPVSFRDNAAIAKGSYGPETYTNDKPAGQPFMSVEQAYYVYKETVKDLGESRVNLLAKIQQARFQQHPDLLEKVKENGGVEWLKECTYKIGGKNDFWEGKGEESPYIRSLIKGYENAIQIDKNNQEVNIPPLETTTETQIIPTKESLSTQEKTSLESNLESKNQKDQIPAFGTMDSIVEKARNNTLEMLSSWQEIARKIGKNEKYLNQINEAIETYKTEVIGIENSFLAMANDIKELEKINDVTRMVQRVASTIGRMDNNVLSAKTTSGYQFVIASSDKNLLVYDKPVNGKNILLYIKEGQVKTNKINDNFIKDLRMMNFTIDNALSNVKNQLVV